MPVTLQRAFDAFCADRDPQPLLAARTELADSLVKAAATECRQSPGTPRIAVAAVGGYGRRELFPRSDVDILLLVENEYDLGASKEAVSVFLRVLWDSDLRVSHSVRTVAECCRLHDDNIELHISLLDLRFLCGDHDVFIALSGRLPDIYRRQASALIRRLTELARHRHSKFNNTIYHLEPNIKEAPGGIRDIHLLRWLAALLPPDSAIVASLREPEAAEQFLYGLRCFLHMQAGRDNNLLSFELQDRAAEFLPPQPLAPETWMRLYFQNARRLFQLSLRALEYADAHNPSLSRQFGEWRSRLSTRDFTISRERVFLRNAGETLASAESLLALFAFVARHGVRLSWDTQKRLKSEFEPLERLFCDHPLPWPLWRDLLSRPHTALALDEMQQTGLLAAAIPEWHSIDSLVVRDFYHRYTVDEHTMVAIQAIDDLLAGKARTPARFHEFTFEGDDQAIVRLALLLHDIGKGTSPGDHVRGSLHAARQFMERVHVPHSVAEAVTFLIEHHLDLSLIMNTRDLEDPATARLLTEQVGTQEALQRLVLLTYADITAVNPSAMTPWRIEQLWRVYSAGMEQLTRELATDRIHHRPTPPHRSNASDKLAAFLEGLPTRYLRTHTREQIEHHCTLEQQSRREGVAVEISRESGAYAMTVLARDEAWLFASLCGALAGFGMNIVKAEAASNAAGVAIDLIRFTDPMRTLELNPGEVNRLASTVESVVKGCVRAVELLKRRRRVPRPSRASTLKPALRFNNEASDGSTLIEFSGEDRPGLLYHLASAISACGCNIEIVMVDTQAHRALDVFYVTRNGAKLEQPLMDRLEIDLRQAAEGVSTPA